MDREQPPDGIPPPTLPVLRIGTPGVFIFPGSSFIFGLSRSEANVKCVALFEKTPYCIIMHPAAPTPLPLPLGLLTEVKQVRPTKERFILYLEARARVNVSLSKTREGMELAHWTYFEEEPIPPEALEDSEFHAALLQLAEVFRHVITEVMPVPAVLIGRVAQLLAEIHAVEQGELPLVQFSQILDGIMGVLNAASMEQGQGMDLSGVSLLVFQEQSVGARFDVVLEFLTLLTRALPVGKTDQEPPLPDADHAMPPLKELINHLFYDESDASEEKTPEMPGEAEEDFLLLPDELESPSIAALRQFLAHRVIGQDRPIRAVARSFSLVKAGLSFAKGPLRALFFAGPTGVGKTELAYALADLLHELERAALARAKTAGITLPFRVQDILMSPLVKVPCGMFAGSLSHGISTLIGAPPGFAGSKGTGERAQPPILSKRNFPPNRITVLLFDEFEKAILESRDYGAELIGILMEILDKGVFTNNWGEEVSFTRTFFIFTSNIASKKIVESAEGPDIGIRPPLVAALRSGDFIEKLNHRIYEDTKREYEKIFSPEFRGRIDLFIVFRFLAEEHYRLIIEKEFSLLKKEVESWEVALRLSDEAVQWILTELDPLEGVRKLGKFIEKEIAEPFARAKNLGKLKRGYTYEVIPQQFPMRDKSELFEIHAAFRIKKP